MQRNAKIAAAQLVRRLFLAAALLAMPDISAALAQSGAPEFTPREENPEDYPSGAGRDETFYACTACHGFKLVAQQGMNRRQWDDSLNWMTEKNNMPALEGKDREIVLNYLEATFPSRAPAPAGGWQNPFTNR